MGLFLTVPRIAHQEMRGTTASPHGLPQTPKDVVCVKRTCEALAQHSRASRRRFSQRPHGRARPEVPAAVPASGQCGASPTRRAPVGTARGAARGRGSARTAVRGAEAKALLPLRKGGRLLASALGAFFNLYINFQIYVAGFACLVLALSSLFLVASQLRVYSWLSDSFCDLNLKNDIIHQENSFRFTVLPFPLHMHMVYSLSM